MKNVWEKLANKSSRILYTQWTLFLHHVSPSNRLTVPFQTVLLHECKNNCIPTPKNDQVKKEKIVSFCHNFGIVGMHLLWNLLTLLSNQQRHVPYTPQISELATTNHVQRSQPWDNSFCQSTAVLTTLFLLLLQLHTKEHITPVSVLEKTTQMNSHSCVAILAGHQH